MVGAPIDIDNAVDVDWENLLSWLKTFDSDITKDLCVYSKQVPGAGRGLFVNRSVPPNSPLFSVPSAAYLSPLTLSKIYGPICEKGFEPDPTYGPYLAMLPPDFASHPLSWLILSTNQALLDHMSPSVKRDVHKVASRYEKDWAAVSRYIYSFLPHIFSGLERQIGKQKVKDIYGHGSVTTLQTGDQIYLKYGSHSNSTLFTEYGFIEEGYPNGGQVDIQDIIEDQFKVLGDLGDWMKSLLQSFNFWGDWILYDSPPPASPSYRLLPALRLLQLSDTFPPNIIKASDPFSSSADLHVWRDTIYGEQDTVSMSNEDAVWHFLYSICDSVKARAEKGLENLKALGFEENLPEWHAYAIKCIEQLWLEELQVAKAVAQSIKSGETGHGTL